MLQPIKTDARVEIFLPREDPEPSTFIVRPLTVTEINRLRSMHDGIHDIVSSLGARLADELAALADPVEVLNVLRLESRRILKELDREDTDDKLVEAVKLALVGWRDFDADFDPETPQANLDAIPYAEFVALALEILALSKFPLIMAGNSSSPSPTG